MERPKKSAEVKMAENIRAKRQQGLTLTPKEQAFLDEERRDNWLSDNPRYGH